MTIEVDGSNLPPLRPKKDPLIFIAEVVAVGAVHMIGGGPVRDFKHFYTDLLGFEFAEPKGADFAFTFEKWRIEFVRTHEAMLAGGGDPATMGKLTILIRQFDSAVRVLSDHRIPFELLHYDLGLSRALTLFDPGGNLVTLIEARSL